MTKRDSNGTKPVAAVKTADRVTVLNVRCFTLPIVMRIYSYRRPGD